ncbi:hypothetical protein DES35_101465 [Schleiferia thermophila]|uniref:Uncharacterized protein n=1 Tax=Schleiferia thermophila TaxID=884107 RepID=A0A369A755_9FLAO|nr:hypothetical protein DES35_101465 [Schleiferia thermophila]GCD79304.1 hypothetical protein JCM30197_05510 [Schleiferia thermophila]
MYFFNKLRKKLLDFLIVTLTKNAGLDRFKEHNLLFKAFWLEFGKFYPWSSKDMNSRFYFGTNFKK